MSKQSLLLTPEQEKFIAGLPESYRGITRKAFQGKSLRAATKAKCLDCVCWQRVEITACPCSTCPLWPYRPYQKKTR